jgi:hypothetical protein
MGSSAHSDRNVTPLSSSWSCSSSKHTHACVTHECTRTHPQAPARTRTHTHTDAHTQYKQPQAEAEAEAETETRRARDGQRPRQIEAATLFGKRKVTGLYSPIGAGAKIPPNKGACARTEGVCGDVAYLSADCMLKCVLFACKETSNQLNKPTSVRSRPFSCFPHSYSPSSRQGSQLYAKGLV